MNQLELFTSPGGTEAPREPTSAGGGPSQPASVPPDDGSFEWFIEHHDTLPWPKPEPAAVVARAAGQYEPLPPKRNCGKCRRPVGRRHQAYILCPTCTAAGFKAAMERSAERKETRRV